MRDELDTTGATESMGLRVIAYYLEEEAREVNEEQNQVSTDDPEEELLGESIHCTWSHVIDALLRRFLTEEVLQNAYKYVTSAQQEEDEDEAKFSLRPSNACCLCLHVSRKADVVN